MTEGQIGRAEACANIALAKYWGKSPRGRNLTAVPSLSLTLDSLRTRTEVHLLPELDQDEVWLNGQKQNPSASRRAVDLLSRIRGLSETRGRARVVSHNDFPTAAGLASSASGFAALALAAADAYGLKLSAPQLSSHARQASASAARSLFSGFAELQADADEAAPVAGRDHWHVAMLVAVVEAGKKSVPSTAGMVETARTCPYYPAWVSSAPALFDEVKAGVITRDFERVADAMEQSTRLMHATMMTSSPAIIYLRGPTVELMHEIAQRRKQGAPVAYTMDAGPNVKVLTTSNELDNVRGLLESYPGVRDVIVCRPGPAARRLGLDGPLESAALEEEVA